MSLLLLLLLLLRMRRLELVRERERERERERKREREKERKRERDRESSVLFCFLSPPLVFGLLLQLSHVVLLSRVEEAGEELFIFFTTCKRGPTFPFPETRETKKKQLRWWYERGPQL